MADKEATVYVVDVARSMGKHHNGRDQTDLDWALQWVYDKITNVVFTGRKTLQIGLLGLGTDDTKNMMGDDASYRHISVLQPISQILMPELQNLPRMLKPSRTDDRDVVSAIILALDMINRHCKHLKYKKRVVVVTNAMESSIDEDDIDTIVEQFKDNGVELVVLGIDFDDTVYGFKEEDKPEVKRKNEELLKRLVESCDGQFGTMQEAIDELSRPSVKPVRPTPTYRGQLRLGDPTQYDTALYIEVERYFKVSIRRPPTASAHVVKPAGENAFESDNLATIHSLYKYKLKGEEHEGDKKTFEREELAKGYEYGRTAVSIQESEQNITKYETEMAYDVLGFLPANNLERYMLMDNSNIIVASKGNDKAAMALSSFIHALFELGCVAIGRLVKKDMAEPILTALSPLVEPDFECLIENVLPFAEDIRSYRFPPVDKVLTVSGKALTEHRNLPSKNLLDSMSEFVDNMMLADDEGGEEMLGIDDTFSPVLHTIESAIKYRAVHADDPDPKKRNKLPDIPGPFDNLQHPPPELLERAKPALSHLTEAANVKKVPPKKKGRGRARDREADKPLSGLNVEELLRKVRPAEKGKARIDPSNAIPEFKALLKDPDDEGLITDAVNQMQVIVENLVRKDFGSKNYPRVLEILGTIRQEMADLEMPALYNDGLRQLKEKVFAGDLGGDRKEFWATLRREKAIGLISQDETDISNVSKEQAEEFMKFPKAKG